MNTERYPKIILNPIHRATSDDGDSLESRSLVQLLKWAELKKSQSLVLIRIMEDGTTDMEVKFVYTFLKNRYIRTT